MPGAWTGVELPAYLRNKWLDVDRAHGEYFARCYSGCDYHSGCVTEIKQSYDFVTWFLPYVVIDPMLSSGLPEHCFDPAGLLQHAWNRLRPGGILFIVNQGEKETELQQKFLKFEKLDGKFLGRLNSVFNPFRYSRYGWIVSKQLGDNAGLHLLQGDNVK